VGVWVRVNGREGGGGWLCVWCVWVCVCVLVGCGLVGEGGVGVNAGLRYLWCPHLCTRVHTVWKNFPETTWKYWQ